MTEPLYVCWTTVDDKSKAELLAQALIKERLAVCVQVDGPVESYYEWKDQVHVDQEFRLWIKIHDSKLETAKKRVHELHPYDVPQWLGIPCEKVGEKYLKWAEEVSNLRGFL